MRYNIINMDPKRRSILRTQLDHQLAPIRERLPNSPRGGWLRTIREALGMPVTAFATKLGLRSRNVYHLEEREAKGTLTLNTLRKAADALNCDVFVTLLPRDSLETMVNVQALRAAHEISEPTFHSMALEEQSTSASQKEHLLQELARDLINRSDPKIWQ